MLDVWFAQMVKPCLTGRAFLVRYADDFVRGCAGAEDARRVRAVLPQRFGTYGLTIHPDKTRLVPFRRPGRYPPAAGGQAELQPGSFDFLGFTHYGSRSKRGYWVVQRKTAGSRLHRAIRRISAWCRLNRHVPIREQYRVLCLKLQGHYASYGVIGNLRCLHHFRYAVVCLWRQWLARRRRRGSLAWSWFHGLLQVLPLPWPHARASPHAANP